MDNKKPVLITIIVLLIVFIPLTIIGFFIRENENPLDENPKHEFYYNNKLWFYDHNILLSSYDCKTTKCDLATTIIDDSLDMNYFKEGKLEKVENNNKFTFIKDGALIYLYEVTSGKILKNYLQLKNYNAKIANDLYIIQDENELWGVLSVGEVLNAVIPFEYNFIGILNNFSDDTLKADNFIVQKDDKWFLIDRSNSIISSYYNLPIIDYTSDYIITKDIDRLKIYNYDGTEYVNGLVISDYAIYDNYIGLIANDLIYIYNDLSKDFLKTIDLDNNGKLSITEDEGQIVIKIDDTIMGTIE